MFGHLNAEQDEETLRAALERAQGEADFQLKLPEPEDFDLDLEGLDEVAKVLLVISILAITAMVVFLALWIAKKISERKRRVLDDDADEGETLQVDRLAVDLSDVEAKARAGAFGDAIHLLLLNTFVALSQASGTRLAPAWTSREIAAKIPLPADAAEALDSLVYAVEVSYFGGQEPAESDYLRCRNSFDDFISVLSAKAS